MKVLLQNLQKKDYPVEIGPNDTVGDLKKKIEKELEFEVQDQIYIYKGNELSNDILLSHYEIQESTVIYYIIKSGRFRVLILLPSGKTLSLLVTSHQKVATMKSQIHDQEGIPIENQTLLFNGIQLEDTNMVKHELEGATITLKVRE